MKLTYPRQVHLRKLESSRALEERTHAQESARDRATVTRLTPRGYSGSVPALAVSMMRKLTRLATVSGAACVLFLAACATPTEVIDLYENPAYAGSRYSRFLVLDTTQDSNERARFEEMQATALRNVGAEATTSYSVIGFDRSVTEEVLAEAVAESGADAVLITQVASAEAVVSKQEGRVDINKECRKVEFYDPFLYDYKEIKEPDSITVSHTVVVIASLYDARNNDRLWTVQSTCFNKLSRDEVFHDQTRTIAAELKRDWLAG